jgi:hypothetical protein
MLDISWFIIAKGSKPEQVEAGVLDRTRPQRRKFRRLGEDEVATILGG